MAPQIVLSAWHLDFSAHRLKKSSTGSSSLPLPFLLPRISLCPGILLSTTASSPATVRTFTGWTRNSAHLAVVAVAGNRHIRVVGPCAEAGHAELWAVVEALEGAVAAGVQAVELDAHLVVLLSQAS